MAKQLAWLRHLEWVGLSRCCRAVAIVGIGWMPCGGISGILQMLKIGARWRVARRHMGRA